MKSFSALMTKASRSFWTSTGSSRTRLATPECCSVWRRHNCEPNPLWRTVPPRAAGSVFLWAAALWKSALRAAATAVVRLLRRRLSTGSLGGGRSSAGVDLAPCRGPARRCRTDVGRRFRGRLSHHARGHRGSEGRRSLVDSDSGDHLRGHVRSSVHL